MIRKYTFGAPIETEAVVCGGYTEESREAMPYFSMEDKGREGYALVYKMGEHDVIYGLGESIRGINKRGWLYESNCTDDPIHTEDKHSLYAAHNFFLADGRKRFGVFVDAPQKVTFDLGYSDRKVWQ